MENTVLHRTVNHQSNVNQNKNSESSFSSLRHHVDSTKEKNEDSSQLKTQDEQKSHSHKEDEKSPKPLTEVFKDFFACIILGIMTVMLAIAVPKMISRYFALSAESCSC